MAMRNLITIALILLPGLSLAHTDCRVVEHPDHVEAVCIGDEKATPAPETPPTSAFQRRETVPQAAPEQTRAALPVPLEQPQTAAGAMTSTQSSAPPVPHGTVVNRQGRQQYQKGMEEARAARLQLIYDLQQSQPSP